MADTRFFFHESPNVPTHLSAADLSTALSSDAPPALIDVRATAEQATGIIVGAAQVAAPQLADHLALQPAQAQRRVVLYCATGTRSDRAAQALIRAGYTQVASLTGGLAGWLAAGFPIVAPPAGAPDAHVRQSPPADRYVRQTVLPQLGATGQARLTASRVLVVGAGGLGSPAALYLAAAGVGTIGLIDDDRVDLTNLQRQILHSEATIGALKVDSAATRLRALNSTVTLHAYPQRLDAGIARTLFPTYDLIVDGSDNLATRYVINDACVALGIPFIYGALYHFDGQVAVFNHAGGPCYRCLYPAAPPAALAPSCAEAGVLGAVCGVIGSLQATAALRVLAGLGDPTRHELFSIDALSMRMRSLALARDPNCPCCAYLHDPRSDNGGGV